MLESTLDNRPFFRVNGPRTTGWLVHEISRTRSHGVWKSLYHRRLYGAFDHIGFSLAVPRILTRVTNTLSWLARGLKSSHEQYSQKVCNYIIAGTGGISIRSRYGVGLVLSISPRVMAVPNHAKAFGTVSSMHSKSKSSHLGCVNMCRNAVADPGKSATTRPSAVPLLNHDLHCLLSDSWNDQDRPLEPLFFSLPVWNKLFVACTNQYIRKTP